MCKFPEVKVKIATEGEDGNIFAVIGSVKRALRRNGVAEDLIDEFAADAAVAEDHDGCLEVIKQWVDVVHIGDPDADEVEMEEDEEDEDEDFEDEDEEEEDEDEGFDDEDEEDLDEDEVEK